MKKVFFAAAILAAATLTGCGNKTNAGAEGTADSLENVDSLMTGEAVDEADATFKDVEASLASKDANGLESAIASLKAKYDELVKSGKTEEAAAYAAKIKTYLEQHADEVKAIASGNSTVNEIVNTVTSLPTSAEDVVSTAKESAENAVSEGKKAVEEKVEAKKTEVKQKANDAVNKAADKANKAVSGAINKAFGN